MNSTEQFRVALRTAGLNFDGAIVANGKFVRWRCREAGDKDAASWFIVFHGEPLAGAFGNFRLGKLSLPDFDRVREAEAKRLGIRTATLETEVKAHRPKLADATAQGGAVDLPAVEPWPDPVDGAELLSVVAEVFTLYVALPPGAAAALSLWVAHVHAYECFIHSPRLNLFSPEKGCGKTLCLDVISALTPRALRTESITPAVLFRLVELYKPTLLLDEVDAYLNDAEELRGLLNAGHKRGARAYRCEGESNTVRGFNAFAPAALAGIGALPGTLHDRSIIIRLVRAKPGELTARFDSRRTDREAELCRKLARWTADQREQLANADPVLPDGAFNRHADNWRPLFAVAEVAGADWPRRAVEAFAKLTSGDGLDAQGIGAMLLADIRLAFAEVNVQRMFSKALVESLCKMSDRPWPEAHRGKPVSETWLALRLKFFGVTPRTLRIGGDRAKGYELADLAEAFARFLPDTGFSTRDTVTTLANIGGSPPSEAVTIPKPVTGSKPHETVENIDLSRCHGSKTPDPEKAPAEALIL